ncbi:hypothetical protein J3A83DRAFT_4186958 [Scleroderma citrinum]
MQSSRIYLRDTLYYLSEAFLPRFGLIDDSPERWTKFRASIQQLNADAPSNVQYKVFFLGRHGQGYPCLSTAKLGVSLTKPIGLGNYWSKLNGNGGITWRCKIIFIPPVNEIDDIIYNSPADPDLTPLGESQSNEAHALWETEPQIGLPLPEEMDCSPLSRAIRTHQLTFKELLSDDCQTTIIEVINKSCFLVIDSRSVPRMPARLVDSIPSTRDAHERKSTRGFPDCLIEDGFTVADELWTHYTMEKMSNVRARARAVLDMIFEHDKEKCKGDYIFPLVTEYWNSATVISIEMHEYFI